MVTGEDFLADVVIPAHPCPPARHTLDEWEREAAGLDHLQLAIRERRQLDARQAWASREGRWGGREIILRLAREDGMTDLDEIADFLGVTPEEVATALVAEETDERAGLLLAVVRAWKAHPDWSARQIARATGTNVNFVLRHVEQLGGKIEAVERHRAGGGKKFSPEAYDAIRELREQGHSYSAIAKRLGMRENTVARICQRRGWKPRS